MEREAKYRLRPASMGSAWRHAKLVFPVVLPWILARRGRKGVPTGAEHSIAEEFAQPTARGIVLEYGRGSVEVILAVGKFLQRKGDLVLSAGCEERAREPHRINHRVGNNALAPLLDRGHKAGSK